eukprot:212519-Chlamydomonas_euryale.AAC.1
MHAPSPWPCTRALRGHAFTPLCARMRGPAVPQGRGGEQWGSSLAAALEASLLPGRGSGGVGGAAHAGVDTRQLCILPGKRCWAAYVDALVLNDDGNVLSALSLAALAALADTRVPAVSIAEGGDGGGAGAGEPELELDDDMDAATRLELGGVPVVVSVSQVCCCVCVRTGGRPCACVHNCVRWNLRSPNRLDI